MSEFVRALTSAITEMQVVDAHEHLWPEARHLRHRHDVLTLIQYSLADLEAAGASPAEVELLRAHYDGPQAPLDERWAVFRRYFPLIRDTAPIRALLIALRDLYGCEDLGDATYEEASARITAARRPGIYDDMLRRNCRITHVLNQNPMHRQSDGFLLPVRNVADLGPLDSRPALETLEAQTGIRIRTLEDVMAAVQTVFEQWEADGTVGLKRAGVALSDPTPQEAASALARALDAAQSTRDALPLQHFVEHRCIALAGERGLPVSVHTGLWAGAWADMRRAHPEHLIDIALRHRHTRFDVYHAGIPWVSESGIMARQLPNLWLNLCWAHVISPVMARRALDEWLDVVPVNKIIGWGGDYWMSLEKVYGHLVMARENIAEVLAGRIERGLMTEQRALEVARMILRDNPAHLYGLAPPKEMP